MAETSAATAAAQLAEYLRRSGKLTPLPTNLRTQYSEEVYAHVGVRLEMFVSGGDGIWVKKKGIPLTSLGIVMRTGMAVSNSHRKRKAAREAREAWREVDRGAMYISNQRLALQLSRQWEVFDYRVIMNLAPDGNAVFVEIAGREPIRLVVEAADYYFVMMHYLAFGQAVLPPVGY